jgi:hypothetical protein
MPASSEQKMRLVAQNFSGGHIQELKNHDQHVIGEQISEDARSITSMKNAQSDLLRLPGEVRNHIYDYCLSSSHMRLASKGLPTYMIGTQMTRSIQSDSVAWLKSVVRSVKNSSPCTGQRSPSSWCSSRYSWKHSCSRCCTNK